MVFCPPPAVPVRQLPLAWLTMAYGNVVDSCPATTDGCTANCQYSLLPPLQLYSCVAVLLFAPAARRGGYNLAQRPARAAPQHRARRYPGSRCSSSLQ